MLYTKPNRVAEPAQRKKQKPLNHSTNKESKKRALKRRPEEYKPQPLVEKRGILRNFTHI
jgi:hypothetical protein